MRKTIPATIFAFAAVLSARAQLPPVPVPVENPITEPKRVLGKLLFWDEQLASDDTIACGSCHVPSAGGADPRLGIHPGPDETTGTPDDIFGSPGVARTDAAGTPVTDELFGLEVQVTARAANSAIGAAYAPELFWDGRAGTTFLDPEDGTTSIATGGALENQASGPILNDVEMAHEGRDWRAVASKLASRAPLGYASGVPQDLRVALASDPTYPELFQAAFGDPQVTAERIAFAIASYERTLVADQTPWDRFITGDAGAMTPPQVQGWNFFRTSPCSVCHIPPFFTDHGFRNIGLRPVAEDPGRQGVTGLAGDRGRFKVPTLRNVGLKINHMHNGRVATVRDAVRWYRPNNPLRFNDNLDPILPVGVPPNVLTPLVDFIENGLTDPRVAAEQFPFDRPTLHAGRMPALDFVDAQTMTWPALQDVQSYRVYRGSLSYFDDANGDGFPDGGFGECVSQLDADLTDTTFIDTEAPAPGAPGFFYLKTVIDLQDFEVGLGATSGGLNRTVDAACP